MEIVIREFEKTDIQNIAKLHLRVWKNTYQYCFTAEFFEKISVDNWAKNLEKVVSASDKKGYVAIVNGELAGDIIFGVGREDSHLGEVYALNILAEYQNKSLGKMLLTKAKEELNSYKKVYLKVLKTNTRAQQFYLSQGFKNTGESHVEKILGEKVEELIFEFNK